MTDSAIGLTFVIIFGLVYGCAAIIVFMGWRVSNDLSDSISTVLANEGCVTIRGWHVYKRRLGGYLILNTGESGNALTEFAAEEPAEAIELFLKLVKRDDL